MDELTTPSMADSRKAKLLEPSRRHDSWTKMANPEGGGSFLAGLLRERKTSREQRGKLDYGSSGRRRKRNRKRRWTVLELTKNMSIKAASSFVRMKKGVVLAGSKEENKERQVKENW